MTQPTFLLLGVFDQVPPTPLPLFDTLIITKKGTSSLVSVHRYPCNCITRFHKQLSCFHGFHQPQNIYIRLKWSILRGSFRKIYRLNRVHRAYIPED